jgi:hypothetical protein
MDNPPRSSPPLVPAALVFPGQPNIYAIRVALGLTAYLDGELEWARQGAAALFGAFAARVGTDRLRWMLTSHMTSWREIGPREIGEIAQALFLPPMAGRPRHLLEVQVADAPGPFELGFAYRECDPARGIAGHVQIALPAASAPGDLLQIATEIGQRGPLRCLVGGFVARLNPIGLPSAFTGLYRWCRRYIGLDVQWPNAAARRLETHGLPGSNWLT